MPPPLPVCFYQSSPQHLYGGQLDLLRFLAACDRSLIRPHVLVPAEGPFTHRLRELEIPVALLPLPAELARTGGVLLEGSPLDRARQMALLLPFSLRLAAHLRRSGTAVLYANNRRAVLTTGLGARLAGAPVFWHIKQDVDRGRMDRLALRLVAGAGACSLDVQQAFQRRHPAHAARIGHVAYGIPLAPFLAPGPDLRPQLGIPAGATVVGQVGSIGPRKGVDLFAQAALALAERRPSAHFLLAGDAPAGASAYKQQILASVRPLIEQGRFHAPGWLADTPALYRTLDLLALPSRVEGFGLVVAEAGAAGVPAVRTAAGGHTETTLEGVTGFVVPIDDLSALVQRLDGLLSDPDLRRRMGQAARDHVVAHFSLDRFQSALTAALLQTARRQRP
jgi:glycosyltransferase involved in cell wall biosynthesis